MQVRKVLIAILVMTLTLVISPCLGSIQTSIEISSGGAIDYLEEATRLHINNTEIYDSDGHIVSLRGVNYRSDYWWKRRSEFGAEQIDYMKAWGVNCIRLTLSFIDKYADSWNGAQKEEYRSKVEEIVGWCENRGIYVILCALLQTPGFIMDGETKYWMQDLSLWTESDWSHWIETWKSVATRFKGRTNILYDLMNEAFNGAYSLYQTKMRACIDAIRVIDSRVICGVQGFGGLGGYSCKLLFEQNYPINRDNVIFITHRYYRYTSENPGKVTIRTRNENMGWKWCLDNNRCVLIDEFNAYAETLPTGLTWFRNFIEVCIEDGYAGFLAWNWETSTTHALLTDWNGTPNSRGTILQEYLGKGGG